MAGSMGIPRYMLLCGATAASLWCLPAFSAVAATATATAGAAATEEIIVTARRKQENLQNVPVAVTALSSAALQEKSIRDAADLQYHVPSLQENNGSYFLGAEPRFTMRGLTTTSPGTNSDASVETYLNEIPLLNTRQIANEFYDVGVQVLRGPQGTLFGKNSDGGAVLFTPTAPTRQFEGYVQLTLGDYDLHQFTGVVNLPLSDKIDLRVATRDARRGPYVENLSGPGLDTEKYEAGRLTLAVRPTDALSNETMIDGYDSHFQGSAVIPFAFGASAIGLYGPGGPFAGPVNILQQLANQQNYGPWKVNSPLGNPLDLDVYTLSNTTTYEIMPDLTLKNIVGYQHQTTFFGLTQGNEPTPVLEEALSDVQSQVSEEFQLQGKSLNHRLDWILGTYYAHQEEANLNANAILAPLITNSIQSFSTTDSNAVFGQATYDLGVLLKGLDVTAGYRYSWDTKSQTVNSFAGGVLNGQFGPPSNTVCQLSVAPGAPCVRSLSKTFKAPNWTIGLDYRFNDRNMIYVASRRGYKAGGFNPTSSIDEFAAYAPEKLTDVEIGVKSEFRVAGMPARVNADLYHADYGGTTVAPVVALFGNSVQLIENTQGAEIEGGELEVSANPSRDLRLGLSYGLTYAVFDNGASFVSGFTGTPSAPVAVTHSLSGQPVPGSSRHTFAGSASYVLPLPPAYGSIIAEADYAWRSQQVLTGAPVARVPSYGIFNLRTDWRNVGGSPVDFGIWAKNLLDKTYLTSQQLLAASLGVDDNEYGPPRTVGVDLTYRW